MEASGIQTPKRPSGLQPGSSSSGSDGDLLTCKEAIIQQQIIIIISCRLLDHKVDMLQCKLSKDIDLEPVFLISS